MSDIDNNAEDGSGDSGKEKKDFVPKDQFLAAIASANRKNDALAAELAELKKVKTVEPPKRYTRADLNAAVTAGQRTDAQADELLAKQIKEDTKNEVTQEVLSTVKAEAAQQKVVSDLAEYKRLAPEILDEDSDTRKKIGEEYRDLVDAGMPNNLATERAAIRAVLGPLEKLKVAKSARRDDEHHEETGGRSSGNRTPKNKVEGLSARQKEFYDSKIKLGVYKDWKEVEAELAYSR